MKNTTVTPLTLDQSNGSADEIAAFATEYVRTSYPEALLVGMNNSNSAFNPLTRLPQTKNIDGNDVYWYLLFARDEQAFADERLLNHESIGVIFDHGVLRYHDPEEMKINVPADFDATQFTAHLDSTALVEHMRTAINTRFGHTPELWHMEFHALPAEYRLTWFRDETRGYEGVLHLESGEIENLIELIFVQK